MQHPDEGMIHSWLDGALSAEESAAVESHVAGCEQCANAVAEARGFIAASSRILTALDDVPRGVIPVAPARKRDLRVFWRAAAAVLVVAGGSFIALREGGQNASVRPGTTDSVASVDASASDKASTAMAEATGIEVPLSVAKEQAAPIAPNQRRSPPVSEQDFSGKRVARGAVGSGVAGGTGQAVATDLATPPVGNQSKVSEFAARAESAPLSVVSVERMIGGSRTTYQVAADQTVTLTETESIVLSGAVATGAAQSAARESRQAPAMSAQSAAAPAPAPPLADSLRGRDSASRPTEVAAMARKSMQTLTGSMFASQPNTISWTEAVTGKKLTLSGNLPVERLQEIKLSIERERAAARAKAP